MGKFGRGAAALGALLAIHAATTDLAVHAGSFPGGSGRIAFTVMSAAPAGHQPDIATVRPDGTGFVNLTPSEQLWGASPDWSADSARIAFIGFTDNAPNGAVYTMSADGSNVASHTVAADFERPAAPSWSPSGAKIVFSAASASGGVGLWVLTVADGSTAPLVDQQPNRLARAPAWSPDGSTIAYNFVNADDGAGAGVYLVNADGTNNRLLTAGAGPDTTVSWSPNGARLVLDTAGGSIATLKPDGTGEQVVVAANGTQPAWSPDGQEVTYTRTGEDPASIHRVKVDGSGDVEVFQAATPYASAEPAWGGRDASGAPSNASTASTTTSVPAAANSSPSPPIPARPATTPGPAGLLPRTGSYDRMWLWSGLVLTGLGLVFVSASRSRRLLWRGNSGEVRERPNRTHC